MPGRRSTSLDALGFDYLDLFLIHWPLPTGTAATSCPPGRRWRFYRDGRARSIGVSNFQPHHLRGCTPKPRSPLAINQIEVHRT
jgi:2,5-diketo-D-gluconate reductase A